MKLSHSAYGKDRVGNIARQPMNRRTGGGYRLNGAVQSYNLGHRNDSQQSHQSSNSGNRHQSPRPAAEKATSGGEGSSRLASGQVGLGSSASSAGQTEDRAASAQLEAVASVAAAVQSAEQKQGIA